MNVALPEIKLPPVRPPKKEGSDEFLAKQPVREFTFEVKVVKVEDLLEFYFGDNWEQASYEDQNNAVFNWLELYDAHYYCREADQFSIVQAIYEANHDSKSIVVVEKV